MKVTTAGRRECYSICDSLTSLWGVKGCWRAGQLLAHWWIRGWWRQEVNHWTKQIKNNNSAAEWCSVMSMPRTCSIAILNPKQTPVTPQTQNCHLQQKRILLINEPCRTLHELTLWRKTEMKQQNGEKRNKLLHHEMDDDAMEATAEKKTSLL